ncbi:hypothetical protein [Actinomycetospora sp. NBC_00405]|uniref:hypothetical protein n=1 Tax=Actinomycetospora sp. NBC_00405 TaxID=2975952 RepID=UPI002E217635
MRTTVSWRHVVLGVGFLALAGARASQGAPVWAAVFALAGAANAWLAFRDPRAEGEPAPGVADADPREIEHERARCLAAQRRWQVLGLGGALLAAGLLLLEPPLAVLGGAAALFAVFRARRVRRYAATLPGHPGAGEPRRAQDGEPAVPRRAQSETAIGPASTTTAITTPTAALGARTTASATTTTTCTSRVRGRGPGRVAATGGTGSVGSVGPGAGS